MLTLLFQLASSLFECLETWGTSELLSRNDTLLCCSGCAAGKLPESQYCHLAGTFPATWRPWRARTQGPSPPAACPA